MATADAQGSLEFDNIKDLLLQVTDRRGKPGLPKPKNKYDEVFPGIILGDRWAARSPNGHMTKK